MKNILSSLSTIRIGVSLNIIGSIITMLASFLLILWLITTLINTGVFEQWSNLEFNSESLLKISSALAATVLGTWSFIGTIVLGISSVILFIALIVYYIGLRGLAKFLDPNGATAVRQIGIGTLVLTAIVATFLFCIISWAFTSTLLPRLPIVMWMSYSFFILGAGIVAMVFQALGYSQLKNSACFDELARRGANKLFWGFLMLIILSVISAFPVIGSIASLVLLILHWVYMVQGWGMIYRSFAQRVAEQKLP